MKYKTFGEIQEFIKQTMSLKNETFIEPEELKTYINIAVHRIERAIQKVPNSDYLLKNEIVPLEVGLGVYSLPSNIYANKIRRLVLWDRKQDVHYPMTRLTLNKFMEIAVLSEQRVTETRWYGWFLMNDENTLPQIILRPLPEERGTSMVLWYERRLNRFNNENDVCDIFEFYPALYADVKWQIAVKDDNMSKIPIFDMERKEEMISLKQSLSSMVEDGGLIEPDTASYEEQIGDFYDW